MRLLRSSWLGIFCSLSTTSTTTTTAFRILYPVRSVLVVPSRSSSSLILPTLVVARMASASAFGNANDGWSPDNPTHVQDAKRKLGIAPLDEYNAILLNEVHPLGYTASTDQPHEVYDLIAIGAGAGGLVSSKQSARRGAKSCMISEHMAGGDCLNVGCVPSKGTLRTRHSKWICGCC